MTRINPDPRLLEDRGKEASLHLRVDFLGPPTNKTSEQHLRMPLLGRYI